MDWYCPNCGRPAEQAWEFDPKDTPVYLSPRTVIFECECGALVEDGYFLDKNEMLDRMRKRP